MYEVHIYQRHTRKYRDGWAGEDQWTYLDTLKVTPARITIEEPEDFDKGPNYVQHARLPRGADRQAYKQAIEDTLGGSDCRHSHDCCGCATRYVTVRLDRRNAIIHTSISFNY